MLNNTQAIDAVINTEAQMKNAQEDMEEDDFELLGKKKKTTGGGAVAGTSHGAAASEGDASSSGQNMVGSSVALQFRGRERAHALLFLVRKKKGINAVGWDQAQGCLGKGRRSKAGDASSSRRNLVGDDGGCLERWVVLERSALKSNEHPKL